MMKNYAPLLNATRKMCPPLIVLSLLLLAKPSFAQRPLPVLISSAQAYPGSTITISGTGFNDTAANNKIWFGSVYTTPVSAAPGKLDVVVPFGASYERISVWNKTSGLSGQFPFTYFTPTLAVPSSYTGYSSLEEIDSVKFAVGVKVCDLDGDGKLEIITVNLAGGVNFISVLHNKGLSGPVTSASFSKPVNFNTGTDPADISFGDLNGDGRQDMAVFSLDSTISILRNNTVPGSITASSFITGTGIKLATDMARVVLSDIDGDGMEDLVVAYPNISPQLEVYRNTTIPGSSTISFASSATMSVSSTPSTLFTLTAADLDGDGKEDIAVALTSEDSIAVLRNQSTPGSAGVISFAAPVKFATVAKPEVIICADMDGDGKPELVTSSCRSDIAILRNTATAGTIDAASFAAPATISVTGGFCNAIAADMNGDGKVDLTSLSGAMSGDLVVVWNECTSGSIAASNFVVMSWPGTVMFSNSSAVGDLNGDGVPEWITNDGLNSIVRVYNREAHPVSIKEAVTQSIALNQNTPNPFVQSTEITYTLESQGRVKIDMFDIAGRKVASLVDGNEAAGVHTVRLDGTALQPGTYFYELRKEGRVLRHKAIKL
ncbi:MAG: FG-GAP-like repeat-containing protein [Chitinophagaceae bacterium]